jgi:hypothetical protein
MFAAGITYYSLLSQLLHNEGSFLKTLRSNKMPSFYGTQILLLYTQYLATGHHSETV